MTSFIQLSVTRCVDGYIRTKELVLYGKQNECPMMLQGLTVPVRKFGKVPGVSIDFDDSVVF